MVFLLLRMTLSTHLGMQMHNHTHMYLLTSSLLPRTHKHTHTLIDSDEKNAIRNAMKVWMMDTCIQFKERTTEADYIHFSQDNN